MMTGTPPKFGLRRRLFLGKALFGGTLLAGLLLIATSAVARSTKGRLDQAREYFQKAKDLQAEFEKIPVAKRTEKNYVELMEAYRRVYFTAPTYGNDTICLMAIAQLAEQAAPLFDKPQYLQKAIDSYEFLLREYPHSQFRFEALLAIARIYEDGYHQPDKALEQYERYLKTFPGSAQSREVKQAIAKLHRETNHEAATAAAPHDEGTASQKASAPAKISDIRFWRTPEFTRVVLEMGRPVKYAVGRVESPERLYVDLFDTRVRPASGKTLSVDDNMLRRIRVAQFNRRTSRVVLDLADQTEFAISELTNPYRLVIDVNSKDRHQTAARAGLTPSPKVKTESAKLKPESAAPAKSEANAKEEKSAVVAAAATGAMAASKGTNSGELADKQDSQPIEVADGVLDNIKAADPNRGGAHSLTRALGLKIGRILIDPGHGGHDTGTIGPTGYTEKKLVLDVAQRLGKLIEERLGSEVIYTRDDDSFISLEDRAKMANQQQADLFISIHANSSRSKSVMGIETYYLSLTADPEALEVAARENAVSQETISDLQGLVKKIALNEKVDESREFADMVQASLRKSLASGKAHKFDRGVKKAPFVVLIGANMPAILAEISFLSNPEEEKRLKTAKYREQIAEALYEGVADYADTLSGVKVAPTQARAKEAEPTQTASLQ